MILSDLVHTECACDSGMAKSVTGGSEYNMMYCFYPMVILKVLENILWEMCSCLLFRCQSDFLDGLDGPVHENPSDKIINRGLSCACSCK